MVFRVDLKLFALIIILYFTRQIKIYTVIMIFAVLHELSHLFTGLMLNMEIKNFSIMPMGVSIQFYLKREDHNFKILKSNRLEINRILVAIAGPLFNIFMILLVNCLKISSDVKDLIIYSNLSLAIFNLLPIYPLDGGRILQAILNLIVTKKVAVIYMYRITNIFLFIITFIFSILIYYYKNLMILFIMLYLWYIVIQANKIYTIKIKVYNMIFE